MAMPGSSGSYPIEPKVKWAAIWAYLGGAVLTGLVAALQEGNFVQYIPDAVAPFVLPIIPAIIAWVAGYRTKHQFRATES